MKEKITIFSIFVFIVSFFSMEARGADWKLYATTGLGDQYPFTCSKHYYDQQSIKRASKDVVRVWSKTVSVSSFPGQEKAQKDQIVLYEGHL
jgi:hypothetical protein